MKIKKKTVKKLIKKFKKLEVELRDERIFLTTLLYQDELNKDKKNFKKEKKKKRKIMKLFIDSYKRNKVLISDKELEDKFGFSSYIIESFFDDFKAYFECLSCERKEPSKIFLESFIDKDS